MNLGIYQSAASLSALEQWQNAVAQNISSGQVTGYRERTVNFSVQNAGEIVLDKSGQPGSDANQQASFPVATNAVNFLAGKTEPTGQPLDLAIQSKGFFQVQLPDGTTAYTRNGQFTTRNDGTLVTTGNMPVLSESGTNIVLQRQGGTITINPDGVISEGSAQVGRLGIVQFSNPQSLTPISGGVFTASNTTPEPVQKPEVLQGYTEASNVSPLHEMVDMVQISRAYEANQKIITNADQQMQKTMEALG
jgi:flagellar basal body rod protein FlgG